MPLPSVQRGRPEGIGWAVIPLMTCGFGTSPAFVYAAARRRSARYWWLATGYGVAAGAVFLPLGFGVPILTVLLLMINWVVGSVHAFTERPKAFPSRTPRDYLNLHAIEVARYRRGLRAEARRLTADDPDLANDLRIGRPDLVRAYDDGGLIDVNHASAEALAMLPELTPEMIQRIVRLREEQGGFVSAAELALHADLPPDLVTRIADYVIFLP